LFPFFFQFPADDFGKIKTDRICKFFFGEIVFAIKVDVSPSDDRAFFDSFEKFGFFTDT